MISKDRWFRMSGYQPHPGQAILHESKARFRVVIAGRRWGKSLSAAKEAEAMILAPGMRGWIVSKTYDLGEKVFREIFNTLILRFRLETVRKSYSLKSGSMYLEFPWESVVEVKSADHPDSLIGEGLDFLIFDECASCKADIWEQYLRPTLTDRNGWALFITTPRGYNWLYDLWKRGNDADYPEWESFRFPSWNNPYLPSEDIDEARKTLSEATYEQEYGAEFTSFTGQVYKEFELDVHVIPDSKLSINLRWLRYRSLDFGYENPFVCLYIALDPEDRVIIYDEYYQRHRTVEQHAKHLNDDLTEYAYTTCDPSGASARATLLENGIPTIASRSDILAGLELVRQQLRVRDDKTPGLYVSSRCVETIREFNLYSYPDHSALNQDEPVKENDHCMDALRYFIVQWRRGYIRQRTAVYA